MVKKKLKFKFRYKPLTRKQKAVVLPVMFVIAAAAVIVAIWTVVITPNNNAANENGVAANGFTAFIEKNSDLGVGSIVTRDQVAAALGDKAKSVSHVNSSSVFNYDGDRKQTATYDFVRADGKSASLYIDLTVFESATSKENEDILEGTTPLHSINGHPAYYTTPQTLGSDREYRILVVNGLKAYKIALDQPAGNVTISEVSALAALIKLAQAAKL